METATDLNACFDLLVEYLDGSRVDVGNQLDSSGLEKRQEIGSRSHAATGAGAGDDHFRCCLGKGCYIIRREDVPPPSPPIVLHTAIRIDDQIGMKGPAVDGHGTEGC